ncbi:MAG TPA: hypothetical protein VGK99_22840 [Acidobacteriota bacterium]|jgi:hypothetical protein
MSSLRKVIVRTRDGKVTAGFAREDTIKDEVGILTRQGKDEVFNIEDIKAIFFVKDFDGDPKHEEFKFFTKQPISEKIWVRVELVDGEILEGAVKNNVDLQNLHGFYLWPSDKDANNEIAYIPRSFVRRLTILSPFVP